ncbi:uncharacterized protein LOC119676385 [Teleopsis dalmanni]|uniref:uncharacterized protein LOC119676385 n=1 Tax=Teleopsis dalmanni TaxID=139649 RepID=UPI0018CE7D75|nr:uncharacterized protein LOC119676385 [Teleopsis dalmanni]
MKLFIFLCLYIAAINRTYADIEQNVNSEVNTFQGYFYEKPLIPFNLPGIDDTFEHQELGSEHKAKHRINNFKLHRKYKNSLDSCHEKESKAIDAALLKRKHNRPSLRRLYAHKEIEADKSYFQSNYTLPDNIDVSKLTIYNEITNNQICCQ